MYAAKSNVIIGQMVFSRGEVIDSEAMKQLTKEELNRLLRLGVVISLCVESQPETNADTGTDEVKNVELAGADAYAQTEDDAENEGDAEDEGDEQTENEAVPPPELPKLNGIDSVVSNRGRGRKADSK